MLTPAYRQQTTDFGRRIQRISPIAVTEALKELEVSEDKIRIVDVWDRQLHQDLVGLWDQPPTSDDDMDKIHHKVAALRANYDEKCIELLGVEVANRFNALYSAALNRLLNSERGVGEKSAGEPVN